MWPYSKTVYNVPIENIRHDIGVIESAKALLHYNWLGYSPSHMDGDGPKHIVEELHGLENTLYACLRLREGKNKGITYCPICLLFEADPNKKICGACAEKIEKNKEMKKNKAVEIIYNSILSKKEENEKV